MRPVPGPSNSGVFDMSTQTESPQVKGNENSTVDNGYPDPEPFVIN